MKDNLDMNNIDLMTKLSHIEDELEKAKSDPFIKLDLDNFDLTEKQENKVNKKLEKLCMNFSLKILLQ